MKKWQSYSLIFAGGSGAILGGALIGMYVWEAFISRIGDPDQSLLFWYLPILFLGLVLGGVGVSMFLIGVKPLKAKRREQR
ncbi:MAG: hypothetical protein O7D86_08680 [Proteobacteria bacterium]|nr:hypothetical protein [Pseudomonadota bacterium]